MRAHLVQIDARDGVGEALPIRLSSVDDRRACHLEGLAWIPAIERLPTLAYDFFGGDFSGRIETPTGALSVAFPGLPNLGEVRTAGSRIRIWQGELGAPIYEYALRFDGRVSSEPTTDSGLASFSIRPDDAWLDKPLLSFFAGTDGIEGPEALEGSVKPLLLGACRFAPGTLIDSVDLVYAVSCYGAVHAVTAVYDRVVSLGASSGNYADLAALLAATIPNGSWATCNALGLVRLGAPADGQVSFDVQGDSAGSGGFVRLPGAIIGRIAELAGGKVDAANLAALDTARPWNLTLALMAQTTAREVIQELADSICAVAGVSHLGTLFVAPLEFTDATFTLDGEGRALPPVEQVQTQEIAEPYWRLATNAEITWVVHAAADVGSGYTYRGRWSAARVYRMDDLVDLENGSAWVYISETASAGVVPGTDAAVWRQELGSTTYSDGTPIDDLQPVEGGSDVTSSVEGSLAISISCDSSGVPLAGSIPRDFAYKLFRNGVDVTAASVWSLSVLSGTITAAIDAETGIVTISAISSDARVQVSAAYMTASAEVVTRSVEIVITRSIAAPTGPNVASGVINGGATGTTPLAISEVLQITVGDSGDVGLNANYAFTVTTNNSSGAYAQWYKWNGSVYVALGSETASLFNALGTSEPGEGSCSFSDTGNTPATTQKYRLYARPSISTRSISFSGDVSASSA